MDTTSLVNDLIEDGRRIVEQLALDGFEVAAAFWLKAAEDGQWYFYIVSPVPTGERLNVTYGRLHTIIRSIPEPQSIDPLEVRLIEPSDTLAKDVLAIHARAPGPKGRPIRWSGPQLGNVSIESAYLYPLPAAASS